MREFSATQLRDYLQTTRETPLLLDVREPWEYDTARIEGAMLMPMRSVPQHCGELDPQREVVVICHHGIRSRMIARYLESQGFCKVINLNGGVDGWAREVDNQMAVY